MGGADPLPAFLDRPAGAEGERKQVLQVRCPQVPPGDHDVMLSVAGATHNVGKLRVRKA